MKKGAVHFSETGSLIASLFSNMLQKDKQILTVNSIQLVF